MARDVLTMASLMRHMRCHQRPLTGPTPNGMPYGTTYVDPNVHTMYTRCAPHGIPKRVCQSTSRLPSPNDVPYGTT